jgi:sugar phosphate isomerase/epimerase
METGKTKKGDTIPGNGSESAGTNHANPDTIVWVGIFASWNFQPGDLARMDEILDEAFDLLGGDLAIAHAKELDSDARASSLALGDGALDWDRYLALLAAAKFNGPLVMHGFEERDAAASMRFLRERMTDTNRR